jgi:hypothetical protein
MTIMIITIVALILEEAIILTNTKKKVTIKITTIRR